MLQNSKSLYDNVSLVCHRDGGFDTDMSPGRRF